MLRRQLGLPARALRVDTLHCKRARFYSDITFAVVAMVHLQVTKLLWCPLQVGKIKMSKTDDQDSAL